MEALLGKTLSELQAVAQNAGLPKFAGKQLAQWLYVRRVVSFDEMTNISLKGREILKRTYMVGRSLPVREAVSVDGTRKYLFPVEQSINGSLPTGEGRGGAFVESVYIPDEDRATLCVSSQIGCKMGCRFCMTGTLGFHGDLSATEILNQIFAIDQWAQSSGHMPLTNIVMMGEGEPMDNLDNVLRTLEILTAPYGCGWSPKRITVSTVGIPQMKRFLDESECHLAVSMHNPFGSERAEIMPAEKAMHITDMVALLKQYDWSHQRRVSFEYICWEGKNDTPRHARELLRLLRGLNCRVNLIRFHEPPPNLQTLKPSNPQTFKPSNYLKMEWFRDYLTDHGLTTTIRRSRGEDISAACGMLVAQPS